MVTVTARPYYRRRCQRLVVSGALPCPSTPTTITSISSRARGIRLRTPEPAAQCYSAMQFLQHVIGTMAINL